MLVLQNTQDNDAEPISEEAIDSNEVIDQGNCLSKLDLWIAFQEHGDRLFISLKYNTDVYDYQMISGLLGHFKQLLENLLSDPSRPVKEVDYLSSKEKEQLLDGFNDTVRAYSDQKSVVDVFEDQVASRSEHTALVVGERSVSYAELNKLANNVAADILNTHGSRQREGEVVAIELSGHEDLVVIAILGVLKSGRAYLLVDAELPHDRIEFLLKDSSSLTYYTAEKLMSLCEGEGLEANPGIEISSSDLAYVVYTSGTTGQPKGVQISHTSLVNYGHWFADAYSITPEDSSLITSKLTFDLIYTSFYGCLLNGCTLHLLDTINYRDPLEVTRYIVEKEISFLKVTPSYLSLLLNTSGVANILKSDALRLLLTGGERQHLSDVKRVVNSNIRLVNHYGPSETTIGVCTYTITRDNLENYLDMPVIGYPIHNTEILILGSNGQLQPIGVPGEICVSGAGMSRGYLNDKELTNRKFMVHPYREGHRLYRTGDVGMRMADGAIAFMDRVDDQVKVRGHRVELGEIENTLLSQEFIRQAIVVVRKVKEEAAIVAYVKSESKLDKKLLRDRLSEKLPEYMLPAYCVSLSELPLTANGKVDKTRLPEVKESDLIKEEYVAPGNQLEEELAAIWQETLKLEKVGITDNFFNIGGDSIKGIRIAAAIQRKYKVKINPTVLFNEANIKALAVEIENQLWNKDDDSRGGEAVETIKI
jgi:amino acid adenylation domain-containing protein